MPVAAAISGAASLGSAAIGYFGSKNASDTAANTQMQLGQQGLSALMDMFNKAQGIVSPVIQAGQGIVGTGQNLLASGQNTLASGQNVLANALSTGGGMVNSALSTGSGIVNSALPTLQALLTPGGDMSAALSRIPGFQFAQDWGQKSVQNLGTTLGLGGNTLASGAQYATGLAQQGYGNIVSALQNLLGSGINYATGVGGLGVNYTTGVGGLGNALSGIGNTQSGIGANIIGTGAQTMSGPASALASGAVSSGTNALSALTNMGQNVGQTQAQGILGQTNALSGGLSGAANSYSNYATLSKLLGMGNNGPQSLNPGSPGGVYGNLPAIS